MTQSTPTRSSNRRGRIRGRRREQGAAVILFVLAMFMAFTAIIATMLAETGATNAKQMLVTKKSWLRSQAQLLSDFYSTNATQIDGTKNSAWATGKALMAAAGVEPKYRAQLDIGKRQSNSGLDYRTLTLWIPLATTKANKSFKPSRALTYQTIDGFRIERRLYERANNQLKALSNKLVAWYSAMVTNDPFHNAGVDYWAPRGCGPLSDGPITCASNWTNATQMNFGQVGISNSAWVNPWGKTIQAANAAPLAQNQSAPYTLNMRSPTPWGTDLDNTVLQPYNAGQQ